MDVPSPVAGVVAQLSVKIGDRVSEGSVLLTLEGSEDGAAPAEPSSASAAQTAVRVEREPAPPSGDGAGGEYDCDVVVIGAGVGGYTAAFRAADLGLRTIL